MTTAQRLDRWRELEEHLAPLVDLGWAVERVDLVDESGEPLRAHLRVRFDLPPEHIAL